MGTGMGMGPGKAARLGCREASSSPDPPRRSPRLSCCLCALDACSRSMKSQCLWYWKFHNPYGAHVELAKFSYLPMLGFAHKLRSRPGRWLHAFFRLLRPAPGPPRDPVTPWTRHEEPGAVMSCQMQAQLAPHLLQPVLGLGETTEQSFSSTLKEGATLCQECSRWRRQQRGQAQAAAAAAVLC